MGKSYWRVNEVNGAPCLKHGSEKVPLGIDIGLVCLAMCFGVMAQKLFKYLLALNYIERILTQTRFQIAQDRWQTQLAGDFDESQEPGLLRLRINVKNIPKKDISINTYRSLASLQCRYHRSSSAFPGRPSCDTGSCFCPISRRCKTRPARSAACNLRPRWHSPALCMKTPSCLWAGSCNLKVIMDAYSNKVRLA